MKQISIAGRRWNVADGKEDLLFPWAETPKNISGDLIKRNKNRSVWKLQSGTGEFCFVKAEQKARIPFIPSKAQREFQAYQLLKDHRIPCAEYIAWSATGNDSIIVSLALPETFCPVLEYWYRQPGPSEPFLAKLCDFIAGLCLAGISHPDFHLGNLMTDGDLIVLLDPVGVRKCRPQKSPGTAMLAPLNEMFGDLSMELLGRQLQSSGLFNSLEEAVSALNETNRSKQKRIDHEWARRKEQIMSGTSKFATELSPGKMQRNSAWFSRFEIPAGAVLEEKEYSLEEGNSVWLTSFEDQLRKRRRENVPVLYEKTGEKVKISVVSEKKYLFFYGFC